MFLNVYKIEESYLTSAKDEDTYIQQVGQCGNEIYDIVQPAHEEYKKDDVNKKLKKLEEAKYQ